MPSLDYGFSAELDRWNEEEHRFLSLAADADRIAEFSSTEERLRIDALLGRARREVLQSKERVAALLTRVDGDSR